MHKDFPETTDSPNFPGPEGLDVEPYWAGRVMVLAVSGCVALKAYAGSAPVTRASGRSLSVTHRHIKNNRLANVGWMWAFSAASNCEPARRHYRQRREHGDRHSAATRHLFNKLLGQLYHCLKTRQTFDRDRAFPEVCNAAA